MEEIEEIMDDESIEDISLEDFAKKTLIWIWDHIILHENDFEITFNASGQLSISRNKRVEYHNKFSGHLYPKQIDYLYDALYSKLLTWAGSHTARLRGQLDCIRGVIQWKHYR